jgi:hypothetical protein
MSASEKASLADLSVVIIFSVLDFWVLGSGFWVLGKKNFPEPYAARFFKINKASKIK